MHVLYGFRTSNAAAWKGAAEPGCDDASKQARKKQQSKEKGYPTIAVVITAKEATEHPSKNRVSRPG